MSRWLHTRRRQSFVAACCFALFLAIPAPGAAQSAIQTCPWQPALEARWGSVDGDAALSPVNDAAIAPDERSVLLTFPTENAVRSYRMDGVLETNIGREGEGPGDFQMPVRAGFHGDGLWVWDVALGRLSVFNADGSFQDSERLGPGGRAGKLRDGSTIRVIAIPPTQERSDLPVLRFSGSNPTESGSADTLQLMRDVVGPMHVRSGQITRTLQQPFSDNPLWGWSPHGRWVAVLEQRRPAPETTDGAIRLHVWGVSESGLRAGAVDIPHEPQALTRDRIDSVATTFSRSFRRAIRDNGIPADASDFSVQAVREAMYRPEWTPAASVLRVTSGGQAWIQISKGEDGSTAGWVIVTLESGAICQVDIPAEWQVVDVGHEKGVAVAEGPYGVTQIVVFRMEATGPG